MPLSAVRFANGPKRSMRDTLGAEKVFFFNCGLASRQGTMASALAESCQSLSNRSLGSPRVGTIHVQAPTPHAPALRIFGPFLVRDFQGSRSRLPDAFRRLPNEAGAKKVCNLARWLPRKNGNYLSSSRRSTPYYPTVVNYDRHRYFGRPRSGEQWTRARSVMKQMTLMAW